MGPINSCSRGIAVLVCGGNSATHSDNEESNVRPDPKRYFDHNNNNNDRNPKRKQKKTRINRKNSSMSSLQNEQPQQPKQMAEQSQSQSQSQSESESQSQSQSNNYSMSHQSDSDDAVGYASNNNHNISHSQFNNDSRSDAVVIEKNQTNDSIIMQVQSEDAEQAQRQVMIDIDIDIVDKDNKVEAADAAETGLETEEKENINITDEPNNQQQPQSMVVLVLKQRTIPSHRPSADRLPEQQKIVSLFNILRTQIHSTTVKHVIGYYEQTNKYSNYKNLLRKKMAHTLLFELLILSYHKCVEHLKTLTDSKHFNMHEYAHVTNDIWLARKAYLFEVTTDTDTEADTEVDAATAVSDGHSIEFAMEEKRLFCTSTLETPYKKHNALYDSLMRFMMECLRVCWFIVLSFSPQLRLEPLQLQPSKIEITAATTTDDDNPDNEADDEHEHESVMSDDSSLMSEIEYEEQMFEQVFGSKTDEPLNYVLWPCIVRTDNNSQLGKILALFLHNV